MKFAKCEYPCDLGFWDSLGSPVPAEADPEIGGFSESSTLCGEWRSHLILEQQPANCSIYGMSQKPVEWVQALLMRFDAQVSVPVQFVDNILLN